jgi:cyanophycinase
MSPSNAFPRHARGCIIPIGGAEDKLDDRTILRRFVEYAGGGHAAIVIIPTASEKEETGATYEKLFRELGAPSAHQLPIETRADCERASFLAELEKATGIFLTGGNQLRLSAAVGGTAVARAIRKANASGVVVAGTSAGAAFLSEHMIAGGDEGPTPRAGMVTLSPGLGLTNRVIIDQHFRQRDRLGRLLTALAYNPFAVGLGLDEDTCAIIGPSNVVEVVGEGAVTVVDAADVSYSSMGRVHEGSPISLIGVRLHVLVDDGRFDLDSRTACAGPGGGSACTEAAEEER